MARLAFTLPILLVFFLFAFTVARTPFDLPENEVPDLDLSVFEPDWAAEPTLQSLLLVGEKIESEDSEPTTVDINTDDKAGHINAKTDAVDTNNDGKAVGTTESVDLPDSHTQFVDTIPLERPFRQANRHFPPRRPYRVLFPHHNCRHGMRHVINPRVHGRQMSYGNDVILATESKESDNEMFPGGERHEMSHGGEHQIPAEWMRFHHHRHHDKEMPRFPYSMHHDVFGRQKFRNQYFRGEGEEEEKKNDREMFPGGERHEMSHGGERQIPAEWMRFHHHRHHQEGMPRFPYSMHHDAFASQKFRNHFRGEGEEEENDREDREEGGERHEMFRGGERQLPAQSMRFHHHPHHHEGMPRLPYSMHHDVLTRQKFRNIHFRGEGEEEKKNDRENREEEGGFMSRFRKFLNF